MRLDCDYEDIDFQPKNASYYRRELKKAQAENAELRAKLDAQDLQVMYLEKRLDAWEKQPYWLCCGAKEYPHPNNGCKEAAMGHPERVRYGTKTEHCKPKETDNV